MAGAPVARLHDAHQGLSDVAGCECHGGRDVVRGRPGASVGGCLWGVDSARIRDDGGGASPWWRTAADACPTYLDCQVGFCFLLFWYPPPFELAISLPHLKYIYIYIYITEMATWPLLGHLGPLLAISVSFGHLGRNGPRWSIRPSSGHLGLGL